MRTRVLAAVLILIALPPLFALCHAIASHVRNRTNGSIISSGEKREYLVYVPRTYDPSRATPLVISLHGAGGWPVLQMEMTGWNALAERERFIVVYPSAKTTGRPRAWRVGGERDVRFIAELIDRLKATYNIDAQRVYANGLSNGGAMTFMLSCRLSDRIAAVGMVAAAQTIPWSRCTDDRAVPAIVFHGTDDPIVPYGGGKSWVAPMPFPDVPKWTANWAKRNRCARAIDTFTADVTRREYTNCDAPVVLYTLRGYGHAWPGGMALPEWFVGPGKTSVDATKEMWGFFRAHRLLECGDRVAAFKARAELARAGARA